MTHLMKLSPKLEHLANYNATGSQLAISISLKLFDFNLERIYLPNSSDQLFI